MRASGDFECGCGAGPQDHVCWSYRGAGEMRRAIVAFLRDGIDRGLRVEYVASSDLPEMRADLAGLGDLDELIDLGVLGISPVTRRYGDDAVVVPAEQVAAYAAMTDAARADGFAGHRVAAEATALVRTHEQRDVFSRYEHLIDRYMADNPFSAMCVYDARVLGTDGLAEIACMHPLTQVRVSPFQLFATEDGVALRGEVDLGSRDLFSRALARAIEPLDGRELVIDIRDLEFIDHRGLLAIERAAQAAGGTVVLRGDSAVVGPLVAMLDLRSVRVEDTA